MIELTDDLSEALWTPLPQRIPFPTRAYRRSLREARQTMIAEYARWQQLRDQNMHTRSTLEELTRQTDRLITDITTEFEGIDKNWNIPKIASMRRYASTIKQMGMITICDTGPKEGLNKGVRASYNHTNRKLHGLDQQVADRWHLDEALKHVSATLLSRSKPTTRKGARQRVAKDPDYAPSVSPSGRKFSFANATEPGTWEYQVTEAVPDLTALQAAVASLLSKQVPALPPPNAVEIKATLGLLRVEGIVDIVRGHPALTGRSSNCLSLCDVSYNGIIEQQGKDVDSVFYGQVFATGTTADIDFVFVRHYQDPTDARGYPCTMQPLIWEKPPKAASTGRKGGILKKGNVIEPNSKRLKVSTVPGVFSALTLDMLLQRVCIVPDYKRGEGNFMVNDLAA